MDTIAGKRPEHSKLLAVVALPHLLLVQVLAFKYGHMYLSGGASVLAGIVILAVLRYMPDAGRSRWLRRGLMASPGGFLIVAGVALPLRDTAFIIPLGIAGAALKVYFGYCLLTYLMAGKTVRPADQEPEVAGNHTQPR